MSSFEVTLSSLYHSYQPWLKPHQIYICAEWDSTNLKASKVLVISCHFGGYQVQGKHCVCDACSDAGQQGKRLAQPHSCRRQLGCWAIA